MTNLLASLVLALATTQHSPEPAQHAAPAAEHAPPHGAAQPAEHAQPHGGAPPAEAPEHGGVHAATAEHGGGHGGGHEDSLSDVMMHHVSDGYTLEFPWVCEGGFKWDCEVDLKHVFGDSLVLHLGSTTIDMTPTKHLVMLWIASIILVLAFLVSAKDRGLVPKGLYNFLELLVQFVRDEIAVKNIGKEHADRYVPYLCTAFFFILFVNLFGLIPYAATATGNIGVTVALATFTFLITQYTAIKAMGIVGWLSHLTGGVAVWLWPIMIPVEILGLFTKPFALTIRLFANMLAGHIVIMSLLGLIFALGSPFVAIGSVPMALAIFGLELFVAFVQAYIFTMLSSLFIGSGLVHHGHAEEHEEHAAPGAGSEHHGSHGSHVAGGSPGHG